MRPATWFPCHKYYWRNSLICSQITGFYTQGHLSCLKLVLGQLKRPEQENWDEAWHCNARTFKQDGPFQNDSTSTAEEQSFSLKRKNTFQLMRVRPQPAASVSPTASLSQNRTFFLSPDNRKCRWVGRAQLWQTAVPSIAFGLVKYWVSRLWVHSCNKAASFKWELLGGGMLLTWNGAWSSEERMLMKCL